MVKEARELVRTGGLGKILKFVAEYSQGWLLNPIDQ
jgi:predicted dehydrogenase